MDVNPTSRAGTTYLLDTNILSELMRPRPAPTVVDWFHRTRRADQRLSVITTGELRRGVALLRHRGDNARADKLEQAIDDMETTYGGQELPITSDITRIWARISVQPIDMADGLVAATALAHNFTVVTRNVKHFERTGVQIVNPFD